MDKDYLMAPGPTPVPPEVLQELARPIMHHRTPGFSAIMEEVEAGLRYAFQTSNRCLVLSSSGTGAMEAALINTVGRAGKALVVQGGKFGERFAEICEAHGLAVRTLDVAWGSAVDPAAIAGALAEDPAINVVCATYCETSTGVVSDIEAIGKVVAETDALLVVDGISSVGAMEMRTDAWHVDLLVVGSQKALMLPPGLAFLAVSDKAWERIEANDFHGYYFDLLAARKSAEKATTPYTASVSLIYGLRQALAMLRERGIEQVWAECSRMAHATREAVKAMGLALYADPPADAVTAVCVPDGVDGDALVKALRDTYHVTIAGGQAQLKGKIFRIAHMGYIGPFDILTALAAVEAALRDQGFDVQPGSGVSAASAVLFGR